MNFANSARPAAPGKHPPFLSGDSSPIAKLCRWVVAGTVLTVGLPACMGEDEQGDFRVVVDTPSAALMAVHGTSPGDVWMVGADDGRGPLALHWDSKAWSRMDVGVKGDLWWVQALATDDVYFAGADANIVHFDGESFTRQTTPGLGRHTVFGLWASGPNDLYAVGSAAGRDGFIWHSDGKSWTDLPLPADLPLDANHDTPALLKVSGSSPDDVWIVGDRGVILRGNAKHGFAISPNEDIGSQRLFTVHAQPGEVLMVGGGRTGRAFVGHGDESLKTVATPGAGLLQGAFMTASGRYWLSGRDGIVLSGTSGTATPVDLGVPFDAESLHAIWVDPKGGVWTVGGNVISGGLDAGVGLHLGPVMASYVEQPPSTPPPAVCPADQIDLVPHASMARRFNEQLLNAVRRDVPRPTVHARNLFHHSIALWDIWAAYDDSAEGMLVQEKRSADDPDSARELAMAFASYRLLKSRYEHAVGGELTLACLDAFMAHLGLDPTSSKADGSSAADFGHRVADEVLAHFAHDGSNEEGDYEDPSGYRPDNLLLVVDEPGTLTKKPLLWQQLVLAKAETQNGIDQGAGVRNAVGTHWGDVMPFALHRKEEGKPYFEPTSPPHDWDAALRAAVVRVITKSAELDHTDGAVIDISPGAYGNNSLGADDGEGHPENPVTGEPYAPNIVKRGDFTRILAEFWADGPKSETPPGHWNSLANDLADDPALDHRLFGKGKALDPLAWDVHVYLALNGALHDAAIAAWELKRVHESARPITLIRYYGGLGQSTDPDLPSFHPDGLPLIDGVIELITEESSAPGERHAHLARYTGELALWSWRGEPGDRETEVGGLGWIRALEWIPYQRRNFVTPAFPGYISGHSTFSRAGAEVLTALTGSPYFPGGIGTYSFDPGYLVFEYGPEEPVELQWATYFDASDQAGQSRLWGGIHITHDDFDGRVIGSTVGKQAVELARQYFDGSAN